MDWKKKFYVLGVTLLCTGVLLAAAAAGDPATRKAPHQTPVPVGSPEQLISSASARSASNPSATLQAAGGVAPAPVQPKYAISHTAQLPDGPAQSELDKIELQKTRELARLNGVAEEKLGTPTEESIVADLGTFGQAPAPISDGPRDVCAGEVVTGTASGSAYMYPLDAYYYYTRSMSLIKRSEITACDPTTIEKIYINITTAQTSAAMTNIELRMYTTAATTVPTTWDGTGTLVYSAASLKMTPTGWMEFDITDFDWAADNLMITWQAQGPSVSGYPYYAYTSPGFPSGSYPQCYMHSDSSMGTTMTTVATRTLYKLKFPGETPTGACCIPGTAACSILTAENCAAAYGVYQGNNTVCDPSPCTLPCDLVCDPGDTPEGEACGTDTNGGCNSASPYPMTPIVDGQTYCGTAWADAGSRDTDWYSITVTVPTLFTWTVTSEFPSACYIISGTCPSSASVRAAAYGGNCVPVSVQFAADAGTYFMFVATGQPTGAIYGGYPCGATGNDYRATLAATPYYCSQYATSTADETIKNFTMGSINNTTLDCDTYNYFGNLSTTHQAAAVVPFSLTIGDCEGSSCYSKWAAIYVDWNADLDFADAGELAWVSGQDPNTPCPDFVHTGSITIPATATVGPTIMRVMVKEGTATIPPYPCYSQGSFSWGAVEDYTLVITPAPPKGACCQGDGTCTVVYNTECLAPDVYKGDGTVCDPNPCLGACCHLDGTCTLELAGNCLLPDSLYKGDGTTCPDSCTAPGACCLTDGTCLDVPEWACTNAGGTFKGAGTLCINTLCPLMLYSFPFDTDPGWTMDGEWQFGAPQAWAGEHGNPDPAAAHTGTNVYGYDLTGLGTYLGNYEATGTSVFNLTTTAISTVGYMNIELKFWRWLNVESPDYDHASILVSNDGATWTQVWTNTAAVGDNAWAAYSYALPNAVAMNTPTLYIRWTMGPVDGSWFFTGWNIDDVEIAGAVVPPQGACCDGTTCSIGTVDTCLPPFTYLGDGTVCEPNPCGGACCHPDGTCTLETPANCVAPNVFSGVGTTCEPNACPQPGACCKVDQTCYMSTVVAPGDCLAGDFYRGNDTDCSTACPLPGDECASALPLSGVVTDLPWDTTSMTTSNVGTHAINKDMFYCWTADCDGRATFDLCGSSFDTKIAVWDGCACPPTVELAYNDDSGPACSGLQSSVQVAVTAGHTYLVQVGAYDVNYGTGDLSINCVVPADGDDCSRPLLVAVPADLPFTDPNQYTCGRGNEYSATCLGYYDGGEDIIYRLDVTAPTCVSITATSNVGETYIGVGVDDACPLGSPCMYAYASGSGTSVTAPAVALPVGTYYVMVDTWPSPACLSDFTLSITTSTECVSGACCQSSGCSVMFQDTCTMLGGLFLGAGSVCTGLDCNGNTIEDACDIGLGTSEDCNGNGVPDECDVVAGGTSLDVDLNGVPDECQPDCQPDGIIDACQVEGGCAVGNCAVVYPTDCGTSLDCQPNGIPDECELGEKGPKYTYQMDDGVSEDGIGVGVGADDGAIAGHTVVDAAGKITSISIAYGGSTDGDPVTVYVWSDPNQDGDPTDAHVLASEATTTQNSGTDTFITVPLDPPVVVGAPGTKFFVGFIVTSADYVLAIDQTTPVSGRNWLVASAYSTPPLDPNDLGSADYNNPLGLLEDYGFAGNLMIRAEGSSAGGDCNHNGIPDDCDIADGTSLDIDGNSVPDECQPDCNANGFPDTCDMVGGCSLGTCSTDPGCGQETDCQPNGVLDVCDLALGTSDDCNANELPDECDIASGFSLDCNGNNIPDECDLIFATSHDWDGNGIPDECQEDCNENGYPDFCDVPGGCDVGASLPDGGCGNDPECSDSLDCQPNGIPDECELGGKGPKYTYQMDDGVSEDGIGVGVGADDAAIAGHTAVGGANKITSVSIAIGGSTNGESVTAYVWSDPNQDGSPADAHVLGSGTTVTQDAGTDTFFSVPIVPAVNVGPPGTKFFVGFVITSSDYVMAIDQTAPVAGRNWIVASAYSTPPLDPNDLGSPDYNNPLGLLEDYGFAGNLMVRAEGVPAGGDCNHNGIPDDCDIMYGPSLDCNANQVPDECDISSGSSEDCNANDVPDECDIASGGGSEDCNGNGSPDECDIANDISVDCQGDGIPDECQLGTGGGGGQLIQDSGMEAGIASPYWTTTSTNYGTVLCDSDSCGSGAGNAGAHGGGVWAWFGGCGSTCDLPEVGTLSQDVTIPVVSSATLKFWLWLPTVTVVDDTFVVTMDGNTLFNVDGTTTGYETYAEVTVDVTAYADGGTHTLLMTGTQTTATVVYINVDDITLTTPGSAASNDCNMDGVPDECNIALEFGGYCDPEWASCSTDYNGNGVPDECELCGDFTGAGVPNPDYPPPDGAVTNADYWYIHDGIGFCLGHPKYDARPLADMDGNGCITLVDYQNWLMCYRMANGKEFVVPGKTPKSVPAIPLPTSTVPNANTGSGSVEVLKSVR